MDRRNFIITSAALGVIPLELAARRFFPCGGALPSQTSICILTDQPSQAMLELEAARQLLGHRYMVFSEDHLSGEFCGDIAYSSNGRLVDYRNANDEMSRFLSDAARRLRLPRKVFNPVAQTLSSRPAQNTGPAIVKIYKKLTLVNC